MNDLHRCRHNPRCWLYLAASLSVGVVLLFLCLPYVSASGSDVHSPNVVTTDVASEQIRITAAPDTVNQYAKFEVQFTVDAPFVNPFDSNEIVVDGHFLTPSGGHLVQPAFYYQDFQATGVDQAGWDESYTPVGSPAWMLRFTPQEAGVYQYYVVAVDAVGRVTTSPTSSFTVIANDGRGFVGVSRVNPRYFAFADGEPFVGVGSNVPWWNDECKDGRVKMSRISGYNAWFDRMQQNGADFGRVWLLGTHGFPSRLTPVLQDHEPGNYDLAAAWAFDQVISRAERNGIYMLLTLEDIHTYGPSPVTLFANAPGTDVAAYRSALDSGALSPELREDFRRSCQGLSAQATVSQNEPGRSWRIYDGDKAFYAQVTQVGGDARFSVYPLWTETNAGGTTYRPAEIWHLNAYYRACSGGDCPNRAAIFTDEQIQKYQRQMLRYIVARWGYSTSIASWELFNEVDELRWSAGDSWDRQAMIDWHQRMGQYLKSIDAHGHLVNTSTGSYRMHPDLYGQPEIELGQVHFYYDESVHDEERVSYPYGQDMADLTRYYAFRLRNSIAGKPGVIGEFGLVADADLAKDVTGVHVHNGMWSSVMSGMATSSLAWHYWGEPTRFHPEWWQHYRPLAAFVRGLDVRRLDVMKPLHVTMSLPDGNDPRPEAFASADSKLRAMGLRSATAAYAWFQNTDNTWYKLAPGTLAAPLVSSVTIHGMQPWASYRVEWWDPWTANADYVPTASNLQADGAGDLVLDLYQAPMAKRPDLAVKIVPLACTSDHLTVKSIDPLSTNSLRQALVDICPGGTIDFDLLWPALINNGAPVLDKVVTIKGPGSDKLIISGQMLARIFDIKPGADVTISGVTLNLGMAHGPDANRQGGGAIRNAGHLTLRDCVIAESSADYGGAVHNTGTVRIERCTLAGNEATGYPNSGGGAIYNDGGRVTVVASRITRNRAAGAGAGVVNWNTGSTIIANSTLDQNTAAIGGAIENGCTDGAPLCGVVQVKNSTLSGNYASERGGAITNYATGRVDIGASSLVGNQAQIGSAIDLYGTGRVRLSQSIIDSSGATAGCVVDQPGRAFTDGGFNLRWPAADQSCPGTAGDPKLLALGDNGGGTPTHKLGEGSAAVDVIPPALCLTKVAQNGIVRPQGTRCDVGAYELEQVVQFTSASISIAVAATPQGPRNFQFFGAFGQFKLDDAGADDGDDVGRTITFTNVAPGRHCFSQVVPYRWSLEKVTCNWPQNCAIDLEQSSACIAVVAGDVVTATFANQQQGAMFLHSYRDVNGNRAWDTDEPLLPGWWSELYDTGAAPAPGKLFASNFTNEYGKWDVFNLVPGHDYRVCQKPQAGWINTQPGTTFAEANNWPCYEFRVQPAQLVEVWFGYTAEGNVVAADSDGAAAAGIRISDNFVDTENDGMYTEEEFVDRHALTPEAGGSIYLPDVQR